jgi:hypothetical protein
LTVNGASFGVSAWAQVVYRVSSYVEDSAEHLFPDRDGNWGSRILNLGSSDETLCRGHGNRSYPVVPEVLLRFEDELVFVFRVRSLEADFESIVDFGSRARRELDVHNGPDDLYDFTDFRVFVFHGEKMIRELLGK